MNKLIKSQEELNQYMEEVRLRGKSFEPNLTTVSFSDDSWNNLEPYDFNKEYIKVTRTNNHEVVERIKYEHTEESELRDWDVTLMDGLENEPYDFQIGSEGTYEHANADTHYTKPSFAEKRINQILEYLSNESFKNVVDDGLFPNHTDKDIWTDGFKSGYLEGMRNERKSMK